MISTEEARWLKGEVVHGRVMTSPFTRLGHLFNRVAIGAEELQHQLTHSTAAIAPDFSVIDAIGSPPEAMKATMDVALQVLRVHRGVVRCVDLRGCTKEEQMQQICDSICANNELEVQAYKLELNVSTAKQTPGIVQVLQRTRPRYLALHRLPNRGAPLDAFLSTIRASCHTLVLKECALTTGDVDALVRFIDEADSLQQLTLSKAGPRLTQRLPEIVSHAARKPSMQSLDLSSNRLSSEHINDVAVEILQVASQQQIGLRELFLDNNPIQQASVYLLLGFICRTLIPKMSLEGCRMYDDSLAFFVHGLFGQRDTQWPEVSVQHSQGLELNLSVNELAWDDEFARLLDNELNVKTLLLNHMSNSVIRGGIDEALRNNTCLERLELQNSGLGTALSVELLRTLASGWENPVNGQYSPSLRYLNLDGCGLGFQGAGILANIIRSGRHPLQYISIANCHIGELGQTALSAALAEDDQVVWLEMSATDAAPMPEAKVLGTVPSPLDTKLAFLQVMGNRQAEGKGVFSQDVLRYIFNFLRVPVRRHVQ